MLIAHNELTKKKPGRKPLTRLEDISDDDNGLLNLVEAASY